MAKIIGEATGPPGKKQALVFEALQEALDNAPPPPPGTDIQHFQVMAVELQYGGFTGATKTRVTLNIENGPLPSEDDRTASNESDRHE
jgi:hypothetical protein